LLVCIAILGVLAGVGIPMYQNYKQGAKTTVCKMNMKQTVDLFQLLTLDCAVKGKVNIMWRGASFARDYETKSCKSDLTSKTELYHDWFINHIDNLGFVDMGFPVGTLVPFKPHPGRMRDHGNPFKPLRNRVQQPGTGDIEHDSNVGFIWITTDGRKAYFRSCCGIPCSDSKNRKTTSFELGF